MKKVAIIGGGAAGFFAANEILSNSKNLEVDIFEKTNKTLSKVKVSGGGRCNVTNATFDVKPLTQHYPRGENISTKYLKNLDLRKPFNGSSKEV